MKRHWAYFKYIVRHKWYVLKGSFILGLPLLHAFKHDFSKFIPQEWGPYSKTFFDSKGKSQFKQHPRFNVAWNHHQKSNPHHWQYWILLGDSSKTTLLRIPSIYVKEMVADWYAAGIAINGYCDLYEWYTRNANKMKLHPITRLEVNKYVAQIMSYYDKENKNV